MANFDEKDPLTEVSVSPLGMKAVTKRRPDKSIESEMLVGSGGNRISERRYREDGTLIGKSSYEGGILSRQVMYQNDGKTPERAMFYENGRLSKDVRYDSDGKTPKEEAEYREDGLTVARETFYKNGKVTKVTEHPENGEKEAKKSKGEKSYGLTKKKVLSALKTALGVVNAVRSVKGSLKEVLRQNSSLASQTSKPAFLKGIPKEIFESKKGRG